MDQQNKQYNEHYLNVIYENKQIRLYDELTTNSYTALYSETQIKLIELIEKYNYKIFYIFTKSKSNLKISFKEPEYLNLNDENTIKIKKLLSEDMYYLYENQLFEVIYTFPKLNNNNNYYFDMLLVVSDNFDLNKINNYNFNLINIKNIQQIDISTITYNWVEKIFSNRAFFHNCAPIDDEDYFDDYYNLDKISLSYDDFKKNYNGDKYSILEKYHNVSSPIYYGNFNQNKYVKNCFMLLDCQIWSLDKYYIKVKNNSGARVFYLELYDINSGFITNFAELVGCSSIDIKNSKKNNIKIIKEHCTHSSVRDNFYDQCIMENCLDKNSIKTGYADLSNLEIKEERELYL